MIVNCGSYSDLVGACALVIAIASAIRNDRTLASRTLLAGWALVMLHSAASIFADHTGIWGTLARWIAFTSLPLAALLFVWALKPKQQERTNRVGFRTFDTIILYASIGIICAFSAFVLALPGRSQFDVQPCLDGLMSIMFLACSIHLSFGGGRMSAGKLVTNLGFLAWAVESYLDLAARLQSAIQFATELPHWPKYIVALGMLLQLFKEQIKRANILPCTMN